IDGGVAIIAKNVTVIALLVAPTYLATVPWIGWIAALGVLAVELAWEFYIKDIFLDTPIESYIMRSLMFHKFDDESVLAPILLPRYSIYRYLTEAPYQAQLFSEAVNDKHQDLVKGFSDLKELQEFIGDNHDQYAELFNNALQYELTSLKAIAFGYEIKILEPIDKDYYGMPQ
uniref:hypothetical protein n=1 Tax=Sulfurimonas sp. TaxID=2022749 RepID=UPI003D0E4255